MARNGLGGRLGRGARLARTGVRGVTGIASAKARELAGLETGDPRAVHDEVAHHLAEVLGEMKGAAMKVGQLLSFVDVDLPEEVRGAYHDALAKLRDAAPPMDPVAIRKVIMEEYGAPPEAVFASWDDEALAAASIGQVHAAKLDDGREVVVKVQYPGVADAVRADLSNAELFTPIARLAAPGLEIEPLLEELRERVNDELDYQREAQYQRAFATRYAGHPFIHVPEVVADLCRARVLVMERVRGKTFDRFAAEADEADRQRVAETIFRYAFGTIARFRLFNGDPHPGNYLIEEDGRVAFLDYGSVKMFSRERYAHMLETDNAVLSGDQDGFISAMNAAGFIPPNLAIDEDRLFEWFRMFMRPVVAEQPFRFTREYAAEIVASGSDPRSPYFEVLRRLNLPPDYLLLNRIQFGVNSVLARLDATNHWLDIRDEYVRPDAEPATELGELDAAWWRARQPQVDPPA